MTQREQRCNENKRKNNNNKKNKKTIIHTIVKYIVCISEQSF